MNLARGTIIVSSSIKGLTGKPRPAIVVQEERLDLFETLLIVPLTSLNEASNSINPVMSPDDSNGLEQPSVAMIQRIGPIRKSEIGKVIGSLSDTDMVAVNTAMMLILGLSRD